MTSTLVRLGWAVAFVATAGASASLTAAQPAARSDSTMPAARPADVASIDAILHAAYDVISGPAGQPRDWNRFYSLFVPDARLIPTRRDSSGVAHLHAVTPREFAHQATDYFAKKSFYESEIGREVNTFGAVTQAFSAYASRNAASDPKPFARGINSFQLFNDGKRWYIVTIYWDDERSGQTIPDRYLHVGR